MTALRDEARELALERTLDHDSLRMRQVEALEHETLDAQGYRRRHGRPTP